MKLISVSLARSIWLFPMIDLSPRGKSFLPVYSLLMEKYKFLKIPKLTELDWQKGLKFEEGSFSDAQGEQLHVTLTVYTDGVVADTRASTDASNAFLEDLLTSVSNQFGYSPHQQIVRRKVYLSELYLQLDSKLLTIHPNMPALAHDLASELSLVQPPQLTFDFVFNLVSDPGPTGLIPLAFRLERAAGFAFSENRYFSSAPLPTQAHLDFLEKVEQALYK